MIILCAVRQALPNLVSLTWKWGDFEHDEIPNGIAIPQLSHVSKLPVGNNDAPLHSTPLSWSLKNEGYHGYHESIGAVCDRATLRPVQDMVCEMCRPQGCTFEDAPRHDARLASQISSSVYIME